jgi:hypothetical protein
MDKKYENKGERKMIYKQINKYEMIDAFRQYGRLKTSETHGNFTEEAVEELFHYYDEHFELSQYELDVVGICCEWTQYDNIDEVKETYLDTTHETYDSDDVFEYLEVNTYHIVLDDDSILVRDF